MEFGRAYPIFIIVYLPRCLAHGRYLINTYLIVFLNFFKNHFWMYLLASISYHSYYLEYIQYPVTKHNGKEYEKVYNNHFAVQQKLIQHGKSTILQ